MSGPGDTNNGFDVFVKDLDTGGLFRISDAAAGGGAGNGASQDPSISGDGSIVVYESLADDLVSGGNDTNTQLDAYAYTRSSASTVLLSDSVHGNGGRNPLVSADGQTFVFESDANLTGTESDEDVDVYAAVAGRAASDQPGGRRRRHRRPRPGALRKRSSSDTAAVSADGDFVAFSTAASNLIGGDENEVSDIYVRPTEPTREHSRERRSRGYRRRRRQRRRPCRRPHVGIDERQRRQDRVPLPREEPRHARVERHRSGVRADAGGASACAITQDHSLESVTSSEIAFVNHTSRTVDIFWLDFAGERVFYNTLEPNGSYTQSTWLTHPVGRGRPDHGPVLRRHRSPSG